MRTLTIIPLALVLGSLAAAERGELPLRIVASGICDSPRPALAIGALRGAFGIRAEPDRSQPSWLPDIHPTRAAVGESFGQLAAPPADGSFLILASLPMPWRPTALERDGGTLTVHGDALEAAGARPDATGEAAELVTATHEFALVAPRVGIKEVRLVVRRFAPEEPQVPNTAAAPPTMFWSVGRFEAFVSVGDDPTAERTANKIDEAAKPGQYAWAAPRVVAVPFGGGDHVEGLVGVGTLDLAHLGDARPPVPAPAKPGDELLAVVVSPVLQTGEWAQVRSLESFLGRWKLTVAVFHDRGGRDKNIPHRDAFIVRLPDRAGPQPPTLEVRFETFMADEQDGLYRPFEPRPRTPDLQRDGAVPAKNADF
jgi:hypothetical protein